MKKKKEKQGENKWNTKGRWMRYKRKRWKEKGKIGWMNEIPQIERWKRKRKKQMENEWNIQNKMLKRKEKNNGKMNEIPKRKK